MTLIAGDAVVTGDEVLRPGWVEVAGGRVTAVEAGSPPRPVDHRGAVVVPGFVDMHTHGGGGGAFTEATDAAIEQATAMHGRHGTTRLMASLVSAQPDELLRQVSALRAAVHDGRLLGIHLEGPWMSPCRLGAHDGATLRHPDPAEIDRLLAVADGTIRMVTLAPELPGALAATRQLRQAGVIVAVGHTDATHEETRAALEAGARVATHLFNAMRPLHHREPGPIAALLEEERVTIEVIADGVHVHPAAYRLVTRAAPDRVALVTDAMSAAGMSDGRYRLGSMDVDVTDGTARIAGTDTIAGSTATMDTLFRFAVHHHGPNTESEPSDAALLAAVRHTSLIPARALGLEAGLHVGAAAEVVVLDETMRVTHVEIA
ncbi:MAG: N-acetylglucosamine-6-phosphate deacetylase [Mobilicoccus sp.]|nr:N-acetylglucosamine-6-phosphate deacetylase [Mobilicoccus sp.]